MAEILQYVHKDAFLHRLHPYTKIAFIIVVSVMSLIATDIGFLILMVLAMLAFAAYGRLLTESLQQLKLIIAMSVIFILITIITMPNGNVLGHMIPQGVPVIGGLIPVTDGGLMIGSVLTLRFMILIFAFQLFLIPTQQRSGLSLRSRSKDSVSTKPSWPVDLIPARVLSVKSVALLPS